MTNFERFFRNMEALEEVISYAYSEGSRAKKELANKIADKLTEYKSHRKICSELDTSMVTFYCYINSSIRKRRTDHHKDKRKNDPEYRENMNKYMKEYRKDKLKNDPEYRENENKRLNEYRKDKRKNDPEYRRKQNDYHKDYRKDKWENDPEYRRKCNKRCTEYVKKRNETSIIDIWTADEIKNSAELNEEEIKKRGIVGNIEKRMEPFIKIGIITACEKEGKRFYKSNPENPYTIVMDGLWKD